ncbi:MAG: TonB-dependent receptor plug domain-containing protein [Steroidobacteraceae bacterium]
MNKLTACLAGIAVTLTSAPGAFAQTGALELEEVIVTATKRETDLQKTSISIQTYSGEELKKTGKRRIDEIMSGVVGVTVQDGAVGSQFYMRGVDRGNGFGPPGGTPDTPTVGVLIDGIYQNRGETVRGGSLDVAQVEVMRGSQGTNLGAAALAGAVSLVTNKPAFDFQANGSLEAGNYNQTNLEGVLNVPFSDNQAIRFAYSTTKRDGYISSGAGESDLVNERLKYQWKPSDTLDVILTVSRNKIGGNGNQFGQLLTSGHWVTYNGQQFPNATGTPVNLYPYTTPPVTNPPTVPVPTGSCGAINLLPQFGTNNLNQVVFRGAPGTASAVRGCPGNYVAVNDQVWYFNRANPWSDGFPKDAYAVQAVRRTVVDSYSADITWDTGIGELTLSPSIQHTDFKSVETPDNAMSEHRVQSTQQFEARLASKPGSSDSWLDKLTWQGGFYYYLTDNPGTSRNRVFPGVNFIPGPTPGTTTSTAVNCALIPGSVIPNVSAGSYSANYCYNWQDSTKALFKSRSLYANATFSILETLRAITGVRYQKDYKRTASTVDGALQGDADGFIDNPLVRYDFDGKWNNTQYRVGLEYDLRQESMVYATFQTGYQPGGVAAMAGMGVYLVTSATPSASQILRQFTVGIKNRFFDNKLQLNFEGWHTRFLNRTATFEGVTQLVGDGSITTTGATGNCTNSLDPNGLYRVAITPTDACILTGANIVGTVANQLSKGVDMELTFLPFANDRLNLTLEYLDSHYEEAPRMTSSGALPAPTAAYLLSVASYTGGATAGSPQSAALAQRLVDQWNANYATYPGLVLAGSSKYSATYFYEHAFHIGNSTLTPRLSGNYRTKFWNSGGGGTATIGQLNASLNDSSIPLVPGVQRAYSKWDFLTTWQDSSGKFSVTGYMRNIGNKVTIQNASLTSVSLDPPRTFGLVLSANL